VEELSTEHVIPDALGGRLTVKVLCQDCNSGIGHSFEAHAKEDPSIRLAIENLKEQIPGLYESITHNLGYVGETQQGTVTGRFVEGEFRVDSRTHGDNSLIQPTPDARDAVETMLERRAVSDEQVQEALDRFDAAEDNQVARIFEEIHVARWNVGDIHPALDGPLIEDRFVLLIAYEFLAIVLGTTIYDANLAPIRDAIVTGADTSDHVGIERLHAQDYDPIHALTLRQAQPHVVVEVMLFRWLVFRVHFLRICTSVNLFAYVLNLQDASEATRSLEAEQPEGT